MQSHGLGCLGGMRGFCLGKVILGVDPGSKITGYAFLEVPEGLVVSPRELKILDAGVLKTAAPLSFPEKIGLLHGGLYHLVRIYQPLVGIFEKPFYGKNVSTTIRLAETRGALIAACTRQKIEIHEITPAEVKKSVTGSGQADKDTVALGLKSLLKFDLKDLPFDAADAVAIAFCYCMRLKSESFGARASVSHQKFYQRLKPSLLSPK